MRVCLDATYGFAGTTVMMTTLAPSEPLLSEATARLAYEERETIKAAQLLKDVLHGFRGIDKGARGELVCMLLLNNARDMAVYGERTTVPVDIKLVSSVPFFFEALFRTDVIEDLPSRAHPRHARTPFKTIFADAKMNFNHFVTVHEEAAIEAIYLVGFTARSDAVLCKDAHMDVDGVNTFVYRDETLQRSNIGVMLWRCTSDAKHMDQPDLDVFARMDPFELRVLPSSSPGPDDAPIPIIRIVFVPAATTPSFTRIQYDEPSHSTCSPSIFTTFDYWCAGLNQRVLWPVKEEEYTPWTWNCLLHPWQRVYETMVPVAANLRRAANPPDMADKDYDS